MPAVTGARLRASLRSLRFGGRVLSMRPAYMIAALAFAATSACSSLPRAGGGAAGPPQSFVRLAAESQTSHTIAVRDGLSRAAAWRALTDYLSDRHTIAVRDQNAGFAMTAWEASHSREGVPDLRYRTRLVVTYLGDWSQLHVRSEASWKEGDEWHVGIDRSLLERTAGELQERVGRR